MYANSVHNGARDDIVVQANRKLLFKNPGGERPSSLAVKSQSKETVGRGWGVEG